MKISSSICHLDTDDKNMHKEYKEYRECKSIECHPIDIDALIGTFNHLSNRYLSEGLKTNEYYKVRDYVEKYDVADFIFPDIITLSNQYDISDLKDFTICVNKTSCLWVIPIKFIIEIFPLEYTDDKIIIHLPKSYFFDKYVERNDVDKFSVRYLPESEISFLNNHKLFGMYTQHLPFVEYYFTLSSLDNEPLEYGIRFENNFLENERHEEIGEYAKDIIINQIHEISFNTNDKNTIFHNKKRDSHQYTFNEQIDDPFYCYENEYMSELNSFITLICNGDYCLYLKQKSDTNLFVNIGKELNKYKAYCINVMTNLITVLSNVILEYVNDQLLTNAYAIINGSQIDIYLCVKNSVNIYGESVWETNNNIFYK